MTLRIRIALTLAFVALVTAVAIAIVTPTIVGRGFARLEADTLPNPTGAPGRGNGPGPMAGIRAQQIQDETTRNLVVVALLAAGGASVLGLVLAGRIVRPLDRLAAASSAVARGDLAQRSGVATRHDEIGALGRSFDAMAADLERAEATRRQFFQDAAHELRTPLAVIEATTSAILDGVYVHDDAHLRTIREQSRLLTQIVDDLRVISLAEARVLPLRIERVPAAEAVDAVVRAFSARAEKAGIALRASTDAGAALADRDRLIQALGAYVDNALRHTPRGGTVTLTAGLIGGRLRITVADTGPGLAGDTADHVFDRFYQVDPARDRSIATSGLGLTVVKALVAAQDGTVAAANGASGGAEFSMTLPAGTA